MKSDVHAQGAADPATAPTISWQVLPAEAHTGPEGGYVCCQGREGAEVGDDNALLGLEVTV